jgi:UDP-N-acetylmuramoyl-tripeptide--D-alanyl-D-alanine ligase
LVSIGRWASVTAAAARAAGLNELSEFAAAPEAAKALLEKLRAGDVVLLKASRAAALERIGEALRASQTNSAS